MTANSDSKPAGVRSAASLRQILHYCTGREHALLVMGALGALLAGVNWPLLNITFGKVVDIFVAFENETWAGEPDQAARDRFMGQVYYWSGLTFLSFILFVLGNLLTLYAFQMLAMGLTNTIKRLYFHSVISQEIAWHDQRNSGEFAARIASDFKKFENGFNENLGLLIYNVVGAFMNLVIGFVYGWKLSLAIVSVAPVIVLSSFLMTKFQSYYMQQELSAYSAASAAAEEAISAIRTVFAFSGQYRELKRYESQLKPAMVLACKRNLVNALGNSISWATLYVGFAIGIYYGVQLIISPEDNYTIGDVVIVFWGITGCGYNIGYAAPFYESFQGGRVAASSILQIVQRQSTIDSSLESGKTVPPEQMATADIRFEAVRFEYPSRPETPILQGLDLNIGAGETVALVGPSGCGKSTTFQLLQRYYNPTGGRILLNGIDIRELNTGWLRAQLGVVRQEPVLFEATIAENIRLGVPYQQLAKVSQEDVERAARAANAHEFISRLPKGYDTYVGNRGKQLSGGQKQRIAIARALVANPRILLLDEATSALDQQSEHVVQTALDQASQGRTTIIIAHRLSTIINAHRIVYLEAGRVVEQGTHQQLMELQAHYYNLVMAQQVEPHEPVPVRHHRPLASSGSVSLVGEPPLQQPRPSFNVGVPLRDTTGQQRALSRSSSGAEPPPPPPSNEMNAGAADPSQERQFPHWRLLRLIWLDRCYFTVAFAMALLYGLSTPIYAFIFGEFVDLFTQWPGDEQHSQFVMNQTTTYTIYFLILAAAIVISLFGIVGEKLTKRLRVQAYSAILQQEVAFFDQPEHSSGALCARLASDAANVQGATGLRVSMMCQALSTLIVSVVLGFLYNWRLALVSLTLLPIIALASIVSASAYSSQAGSENESSEKASKIVIEVVNAIRTVVSLHKEQYFCEKFESTMAADRAAVRRKCLLKSLVIAVSLGVQFFAYTVTFLYGGYLISQQLLSTGSFFKIVESMVWGAVVVGQSAVLSSDYTKAKIAAMNIFKLIDRRPVRTLTPPSQPLGSRSQGDIALRGVHFRYPMRPSQPILNGLSFKASRGERVALVGTSGCGKSTTIQLLERFYECEQGVLLFDGQPLNDLEVEWLRSQMALVSQEPALFSYSIKDNIGYGDNARGEQVPFEQIVRAAQLANIHEFIQKLPQGYDTPVGSKGAQLSGGQKQRIAIARALVRDPPVLLLDEATSALDQQSEQVVQQALDEASKGRTCIIIAHRLKTIVNADKIVVLHRGQNVEEGTHEELMQRRGHYWRLHNAQ